MKKFTIIKVGYTSSQSGCTGEYFTVILCTNDSMESRTFEGIYGGDSRIRKILKDKGFKEYYTKSIFGKLTKKEARFAETEEELVNAIELSLSE